MGPNQSQIKDLIVKDATAAAGLTAQGKVCYIVDLKSWFAGMPGSETANNIDVVASADEGYYWGIAGSSGLLKGAWEQSGKYREGVYVTHKNMLWRATKDLSSANTEPSLSNDDWSAEATDTSHKTYDKTKVYLKGTLFEENKRFYILESDYDGTDAVNQKEFDILVTDGTVKSLDSAVPVITDHDPDVYYYKDDVVFYGRSLYRCSKAKIKAVWDDGDWQLLWDPQVVHLPWNTTPISKDELRIYGNVILKAKADKSDAYDPAVTAPPFSDYEFYDQLTVESWTSGSKNLIHSAVYADGIGSLWRADLSTDTLVESVEYVDRVGKSKLISVGNVITPWTGSTKKAVATGQLFTYNGATIRAKDTFTEADNIANPNASTDKYELVSLDSALSTDKLMRADTFARETAANGVVYISPNQHGGRYGTVLRLYFGQQTAATNEVLDNASTIKLLESNFEVSVWVAEVRGTGNANFREVHSGANWPADPVFRVRALVDLSNGQTAKIKVQQGDSVRVESGWVDFTSSSNNYKAIGDILK